MRILYVEDNEVNQALVGRVSRAQEHDLVFCTEGEQALHMLETDSDIDLILLDIELAGIMTGIDVVKRMRARNDKRPVIAVTAYAMMGDREKMLDAGCDQYLPKPLQIPDLLHVFAEYAQKLATKKVAAAEAASPWVDAEADVEPALEATPQAEQSTEKLAKAETTAEAGAESDTESATQAEQIAEPTPDAKSPAETEVKSEVAASSPAANNGAKTAVSESLAASQSAASQPATSGPSSPPSEE